MNFTHQNYHEIRQYRTDWLNIVQGKKKVEQTRKMRNNLQYDKEHLRAYKKQKHYNYEKQNN